MSSPMVQEKLKLNKDLFEYLEHWSGNRINNFDDVQDLYSTLYAEVSGFNSFYYVYYMYSFVSYFKKKETEF